MSKHMQRNYRLKHAVTAAISLIALGFQSSSYALGLGDIDVKSSLGQPLKATVNVLGAGDLKDTSCLRLGPNSDLSFVNFILGPLSGDIAKLTVTSNKMINDPIVNLSIIAGCDSSIRRDYVLLLDPPLSTQAVIAPVATIKDVVNVQNTDTNVETSASTLAASVEKALPVTSKKQSNGQRQQTKKTKKSAVVAQKAVGITTVTSNNMPEIKPETPKARLTISGGSDAMLNLANNMSLRLDKQLSFTPNPSTATINEDITIEDEVTVMNKRLAHLQQQITTLQNQNLKLTSENKLKSEQLTQADTFKLSSLLPLLGAGLLLIGGYISYQWFRRRQTLLQNHQTEAIWTNTSLEDADIKENKSKSNNPVAIVADDIFADLDFGIKASNQDDQLRPNSMESTFESTKNENQQIILEDEEQFSVLDHADVFLSHGRSTLAIQLLQNHLLDHPKQSVTIWLFLLDLLAKEGLEKLYSQTAEDCKLHFNVQIAEFSKPESISNESLEDFPHLAKGLEGVWNTPAAVAFLDDLIYNNRLEPRAGLAKNLIEELILLRTMALETANTAEVIHLDQKKLAIIEQKEALLEKRKAEKLNEIAEMQRIAVEKAEAEKNETDFEFTLVEKY
jgi:hypothetical protein